MTDPTDSSRGVSSYVQATRRALLVSRNFPPLTGGMERLNHRAYLAMQQQYAVAVCGPLGAERFLRPEEICRETPLTPLGRYLMLCQWHTLRLAQRTTPEVIYSGSGLTAPAALMAGRTVGARVVSFLHGLDIVADHWLYRALFLPAIRRCDRLLVNSHHTARLASRAGVAEDRISIVHPGVDLPDWTARAPARIRFRERLGLSCRPMLLAAGRLTERKGLAPFIREVLPELILKFPEIVLVIVGSEATQALKHRKGVGAEIHAAIEEVGAEQHVVQTGAVDDAALSEAYFAADLLVFPVLDLPGDVEGFGMVAIEAAAHGLPTVAFEVGGVGDAVAEMDSGWLLAPGNYAEMKRVIRSVLAGERRTFPSPESCRAHAERHSWDVFSTRFLKGLDLETTR